MSWVRSGYCCRCGDCCRGDPFTGENPDKPCPLLVPHDGITSCANRVDGYYTQGCNVWPTKPEQISGLTRCTYSFEWVDG